MSVPQDGSPPLEDFVKDVSDPNSPNYRHYITDVGSFASKYGSPNTGQIETWATGHGFVTKTFGNHLLVSVRGTAAAVEQALYVNLNYYLRPDGTKFYGPDRDPYIDTTAPVLEIGHLNDFFVSKPANGTGCDTGTCREYDPPPCADAANLYIGDDLRRAYAYDSERFDQTTLTGSGECVGLIGGDAIALGDQEFFWQNAHRNLATMPMPVIKGVNASNDLTADPCYVRTVDCRTSDPVNKGQYLKSRQRGRQRRSERRQESLSR